MSADKSDETIYEEAKKRVKARRYFWGYFVVYAVVNIILFLHLVTGGTHGFSGFGVINRTTLLFCEKRLLG